MREALAEQPNVRAIKDTEVEPEAQLRYAQWAGALALGATAEVSEVQKKTNILEVLRLLNSTEGSLEDKEEAEKWLDANIGTAVFEALFKEGYVSEIYMDLAADSEPSQYGQSNDSIYNNGARLRPNRHPLLQAITDIEGLNRHRIEVACEKGILNDHYALVWSLVPGEVPEKDLGPEGDGYFTDDMTLSVQATTVENGRLKVEAGFVRGVEAARDDDFATRQAKRHDFKALANLCKHIGQTPPRTAAEALNMIWFVPKTLMPNGVVDPMRWFDLAADETLGRTAAHNLDSYLNLKRESRRKEDSVEEVKQKVREDLLVVEDQLEDPIDAVLLMWEFIKKHALDNSYTNLKINPGVFGQEAAPEILLARYYLAQGQVELAQQHKEKASKVATVSGCGGGASKSEFDADGQETSHLDRVLGKDKYGKRWFRCSNGHLNIRKEKDKLIDKCQHTNCKAKVKC